MTKPVRTFITYAWESDSYRNWVKSLAMQLRSDGIDARLDSWHLDKGLTIAEFMNREVRLADQILVLCSPEYQRKVHLTEEGKGPSGVGWESMLLSSSMFTGGVRDKVVPALAMGNWAESAPMYLSGLPYIDLTSLNETGGVETYRELVYRLIGMQSVAPPLGKPPAFVEPSNVEPFFKKPISEIQSPVLPPSSNTIPDSDNRSAATKSFSHHGSERTTISSWIWGFAAIVTLIGAAAIGQIGRDRVVTATNGQLISTNGTTDVVNVFEQINRDQFAYNMRARDGCGNPNTCIQFNVIIDARLNIFNVASGRIQYVGDDSFEAQVKLLCRPKTDILVVMGPLVVDEVVDEDKWRTVEIKHNNKGTNETLRVPPIESENNAKNRCETPSSYSSMSGTITEQWPL